jgi:uncharacterized membrane protein
MTLNAPSLRRSPVQDVVLWTLIALVGILLAALSIARYQGYNAGMLDLGNMSQAIASVLRGEPLVYTEPRGVNLSRLSWHTEVIYFLLAPLYALWADPRVLLIAQAALAVSGAIPAYRLAFRRLDSRLAARCVALIYLFYPVAQTAVLFDLHGDTLAMPLLMFALDALDRRAWRSYAFWIGLALLSKLYIALPVAGIGAYLFLWGGERRAGLITAAVAVGYGALLFFGVREWFAPPELEQSAASSYLSHYYSDLSAIAVTLPTRLINALIVFGPALLLAWRGWRWLLVASPLALAALISTGPGAVYDYRYHHYAVLVPFIVMAVVDGAARLRAAPAGSRRNWRNDLVFTAVVVVLVSALLVDTPLNPMFWLGAPGQGRDHAAYGRTERDALKDRWLAVHVPAEAPIAASMFLAPRLVERSTLYIVRYNDDPGGERLPSLLPQVEYVVADALFDWRQVGAGTIAGGAAYEQAEIGILLRDPQFALVQARDGLLLFARTTEPEPLPQSIAVVERSDLPAQPLDFGPVRLLGARVTPLGDRRFQAEFAWQRTNVELPGPIIAVSRLDGAANARMPHLPSYTLLPPAEWAPGAIVLERFVVEVPPDVAPGRYTWRAGWYRLNHPEAHATDARSRVPGSAELPILTIDVPTP